MFNCIVTVNIAAARDDRASKREAVRSREQQLPVCPRWKSEDKARLYKVPDICYLILISALSGRW
jgi:hypothetical protein